MASTALISGRARNREIAMDFPTLVVSLHRVMPAHYVVDRYSYKHSSECVHVCVSASSVMSTGVDLYATCCTNTYTYISIRIHTY